MSTRLPKRPRGQQSPPNRRRYQADRDAFCQAIGEIKSTLDFEVSSRGWCYILEEHGLEKGDFDSAQNLINDCRKSGELPLDICAVDEGRAAHCIEDIDTTSPEEEAESWVDYLRENAQNGYTPISFWEDLDTYVQMTVEKIDLIGLFEPVCEEFHVPLHNISGWNDINTRAAIMKRFKCWERRGKRCVLLHCGDHDPGGLQISKFLRSNFMDVMKAVRWSPHNLHIDRFGLNYDFIQRHRLTWIDNLITGAKGKWKGIGLADERHPDHDKPYVQNYIEKFGVRKCEANALVVRAEAGRALCRKAILKYVPEDAPDEYEARLEPLREEMQQHIIRLLAEDVP
jgi:hypothetical protein